MSDNQIQEAFYGLLETMPLLLNERQRRLFYGCAAHFYGRGGVKLASERCGANPRTVMAGMKDLTNPMREQAGDESVRRAGAGRPSVKEKCPEIMEALDEILDGNTFGDPEKVILWTNLSLEKISSELKTRYGIDAGKNKSIRWKYELALLAEETGLEIHVSHFPPGTSKWNKIEHRLFCYISRNWAGKPLIDIRTVVNLIGSTTTKNGLKVRCVVDYNQYPTGIKISEKQMACIDIQYPDYDNSWNYRGRIHRKIPFWAISSGESCAKRDFRRKPWIACRPGKRLVSDFREIVKNRNFSRIDRRKIPSKV